MSSVSVIIEAGEAILASPYNADVPPKAKAIGGRWHPATKTWRFDARDEDRVLDLARSVYGTDGREDSDDVVTVRVKVGLSEYEKSKIVCGRIVAERRSRDGDVWLAPGVVVAEGAFPGSGGSVRNPRLGGFGVVLEVRDIPRAAAEAAGLEIVSEAVSKRASLEAERAALLVRLAEIDAEMEAAS